MRALTSWVVINNFADGIRTATSWAGVNTFHADASQGRTAFRTDKTLWSAIGRRSNMTLEAGADADSINFSLLTVRSTRVWIARIKIFNNWFSG